MRDDRRTVQIIVNLALVLVWAVFVFVVMRKLIGKVHKLSTEVTEKDFEDNGPEIVRKEEEDGNDDRY